MHSGYSNLHRQFRVLTSTELEQQQVLAMISDSPMISGISWADLLSHPRVLLLAEAGSGKTTEMREAASRLNAEGKYAFVLPLEDLDKEGVLDILTGESMRRFMAWQQDGHSIAWFFLDAVDELKLHLGTLDRALRRFSKSVDGLLGRLRVVVSSRPHDWQPVTDMATLNVHLPIVESVGDDADAADPFLGRLRRTSREERARKKKGTKTSEVLTVVMLPLGSRQIETFVRQMGDPQDAPAFLAEIERQHAETFARRPADLHELMLTWKAHGTLGTRQQQHEANVVTKLAAMPSRPDAGLLTDLQARSGAEHLALALALTRRRTIRSPEQLMAPGHNDAMLNPAVVLDTFTPDGRAALLRRGLFDPATYGRIRFHDRSVQEYLAAKRLLALRSQGMSRSALFRLLFAEMYGERVVLPSMRPITSWLALWDSDVKNEVIARAPEVLLSMGDPEALPREDRARLVIAFASAYGTGHGRGMNVPIDEVRRLATPELDESILALWKDHKRSDDVSELLLELAWQSGSAGCKEICLEAALDPLQPPYQRAIAIRALVKSGCAPEARQVAGAMLANLATWPPKVIHGVTADLFPGVLTLDELIEIGRTVPEPKSTTGGFGWQAQIICRQIEPLTTDATRLRDWLADVIWDERDPDRSVFDLASRRSYLGKALALLCERQLQTGAPRADSGLARACAVANRLVLDRDDHADELVSLRKEVGRTAQSRESAFWADVALIDVIEPEADDWHRYFNAIHHGIVPQLGMQDRTWLESALRDSQFRRAPVAVHGLIQIWLQQGRSAEELDRLRSLTQGLPALLAIVEQAVVPSKASKQLLQWEADEQRRQAEYERKERNRLDKWSEWREEVVSDPGRAFSADKLDGTLVDVYKWLDAGAADSVRAHVWDKVALVKAFDERFARAAEAAFKGYWRTLEPKLSSRRPSNERSVTPYSWMMGICGVSAEAQAKGWAVALTPAEAKLAVVLSTVELNGLAEWIVDLATAYPQITEEVLGDELDAQVAEKGLVGHVPLLQDIRYAASLIQGLLAPRVHRLLLTCTDEPNAKDEEGIGRFSHALEELVDILSETTLQQDRISLAQFCLARSASSQLESISIQWLRAGMRFDFEAGAAVLESRLRTSTRPSSERFLAAIFDRRSGVGTSTSDLAAQAKTLGRLVRAAYGAVRVSDDEPIPDGAFTPTTRNHAEDARSALFGALLRTPGPQAHSELVSMAHESLFAHMPDRLQFLVRERAADEAEFAALDETSFQAFIRSLESPAIDRDSLFEIMRSRLEDLQHDIADHDFSDRATLRTIKDETEMQRTLAMRLDQARNSAYVVTREDEVADKKKTDIRLSATRGSERAVIEVKILDKRWSVADLKHSLEHQVLGQYLRHANTRAGCFLLTYNGDRLSWRDGRSGPSYTFYSLVKMLQAEAAALELREGGRVRMAVNGLDLRDPSLVPAQRPRSPRKNADTNPGGE